MNKKLLSLVLSLVMVLGTFTSVFANAEPEKKDEKTETKVEKVEKIEGKDNKIQYIIDKKFVEGYGNGDYGYDKNIKRSEITKLLVFANGDKALAEKLQGTMKLYKDVDTSYWANGVIAVGTTVPSEANNQAMLNGYPDGNFLPENNVSYAELSKMLVVLVKKDLTADMVKEANKHWAGQWMTWAAQLGILNDVEVKDSNAAATRADAFTMVYNALYAMKNFKVENTEAKLGILSNLTNNKLTLNQDSKQEYTVTNDTVYVEKDVDRKEVKSNVIKVKAIKDADYYLGALVRVMVNDKNEVTHILELGNPKDGALLVKDTNTGKDNDRWNGVADKTASTEMYTAKSLEDIKVTEKDSYATLIYDGADVDKINVKGYNGKELVTIKNINYDEKDTKVFIANPAQNQMKEVKDIYEALRLIGYDKAENIPNVYVGYDQDSRNNVLQSEKSKDAKVIVFNLVTKDNLDEETYRVLESSRSNGNFTLETVEGETKSQNDFNNRYKFPFASFEKFDVVKYTYKPARDSMDWEYVIDHSDEDKYPIVKVVEKDDNYIVVKDYKGRLTILDVKDADIFAGKDRAKLDQEDKIKVNDVIQFAMDKKNKNTVDVVSVINGEDLDGVLSTDVVSYYIGENERLAKITAVEENADNENWTVKYDYYDELLKEAKHHEGSSSFVVTNENEANLLKKYIGKEYVLIRFAEKEDKDQKFEKFNKLFDITVNGAKITLTDLTEEAEKQAAAAAKEERKQAAEAALTTAKTNVKDVTLAKETKEVTVKAVKAEVVKAINDKNIDVKVELKEDNTKADVTLSHKDTTKTEEKEISVTIAK